MKITRLQDALARVLFALIIFIVVWTWGKPDQPQSQVVQTPGAETIIINIGEGVKIDNDSIIIEADWR